VSRRRDTLRDRLARRTGPEDRGAILLLALGFIVAASLIVLALASWATNDIKNTTTFVNVSQMQQDARSTANVAIDSIRYHPLLGVNQTLNQFAYCWGTAAPSSQSFQYTTEGAGATQVNHATITMNAYCSTVWDPQSAISRVVTIDVCPSTISTMSVCVANPYLQAIVQFDDYPANSTTAKITGLCSTWCGQGMTITNWTWGSSGTAQLANVITVTSTAPNPAYVQGSAYVPVYSASGGTVVISSLSPSVCVVSSGYVEFVAQGNCTLAFDDSGNVNYLAAPEVTQSFSVDLNNPARLTLSPSTPVSYAPGTGYSTPLTTSGGSGSGAVSYAIVAGGTASGCVVSGSTLSSTSAGTCRVLATKASDGVYAAVSTTATVTFAEATQSTLIISSPTTVSNNGTTIASALTTTGGSGTGAVTYQVTNGSATGCTVNPSTSVLSATSEGTCNVVATKASDGNYQAVQSAVTTITFQQGVEVDLTFTSPYTPSPTPDHLVTSVTGFGSNGAPTGTVIVYSNSTVICSTGAPTTSGLVATFTCDLPSSLYISGTLSNVYALYVPGPTSPYLKATSSSSSLTITRSGTIVTLTPMMVHGTFNQPLVGLLYGYEQDAVFNVSVTSTGGVPAAAGDTVTVTASQQNSATCVATLNAQGQGSCSLGATAVRASSNGASMTLAAAFAGDSNLSAGSSAPTTIPLYTSDPNSIASPSFNAIDQYGDGTFYGTTSSNSLDNGQTVTVNYCAYYQGTCLSQLSRAATATDSRGSWTTPLSQYLWWEYYYGLNSEAQASEPDYYGPTLTSAWNTGL
jgi:hypothetical protein